MVCMKDLFQLFYFWHDVINNVIFLLLIEISGKILILSIWLLCDYWSALNNLFNHVHVIRVFNNLIFIWVDSILVCKMHFPKRESRGIYSAYSTHHSKQVYQEIGLLRKMSRLAKISVIFYWTIKEISHNHIIS